MRIDLTAIDTERFHLNERTIPGIGDVVLVVPHKAMWDWRRDELHLRSLLCRPDGVVISAGFPKFFNFGENPESDERVREGISYSYLTEKVDGSLIIRTVIDGVVNLRTRGSEVIASDMREDVERLIRDGYPQLLDPDNGMGRRSYLFEYVSPKNQIVVKYDRPGLINLGVVDFASESLRVIAFDGSFAEIKGPRVAQFDVADADELRALVKTYDSEEGIVTYTQLPDGDWHLCKFKSDWYLRLHSLRTQATPRYMREFCYLNGITSLDQLQAALLEEGFDWEVVSYIEPLFEELRTHTLAIERRLGAAETKLLTLSREMSRKDIALTLQRVDAELGGGLFGYMMARATGETAKAFEIADALKLDMSVTQLRHLRKTGIERLGSSRAIDDA